MTLLQKILRFLSTPPEAREVPVLRQSRVAAAAPDAGAVPYFLGPPVKVPPTPPAPPTGVISPVGLIDLGPRGLGLPGIDGERERLGWADIETSPGVFNWAAADAAVARKKGVLGLSVVMLTSVPDFVKAKRWDLGTTDSGHQHTAILPWDPDAQPALLAFIKALCLRYDGKVDYIAMGGLGAVIESYICPDPATIEMTEAAAIWWWKSAVKIITDAHATNLKQTPFIFTAAKPFKSQAAMDACVDVCSAMALQYGPRFGIMDCSLNAHSGVGYEPNGLVRKFSATNPVGLQFLCSARGFGGHDLGGTLEEALICGVSIGARFIEVYPADAEDAANKDLMVKYSGILHGLFPRRA